MNEELAELLRTPREDLDIELKRWMEPTDKEVQGKFAKELLALRNHGGGFLVVGFKDENPPVPDPNRPADLNGYDSDYFNNIIKRYAEPSFHCVSYVVKHPETGLEYPVVVVPGGATAPVRCKSDSPDGGKSAKLDTYYIRRPGPESSPPQSGAEWDTLLQRCLLARKDELLSTFAAMLGASSGSFAAGLALANPAKAFEALTAFRNSAVAGLEALQAGQLAKGDPATLPHGRNILSAHIIGDLKQLNQRELLDVMAGLRRYTGWSPLYVFNRKELAPYPLDDKVIECWLARDEGRDEAHADFWRVSVDGMVTLVRGYQEDGPEMTNEKTGLPAGTGMELTFAIWRVAEFLLRIEELGEKLANGPFSVQFIADWEGLQGRKLFSYGHRRNLSDDYAAQTPVCRVEVELYPNEIKAALPAVCSRVVGSLLRRFSFFEPPAQLFGEEVGKLLRREYV
jgi:hypothetical protein